MPLHSTKYIKSLLVWQALSIGWGYKWNKMDKDSFAHGTRAFKEAGAASNQSAILIMILCDSCCYCHFTDETRHKEVGQLAKRHGL